MSEQEKRFVYIWTSGEYSDATTMGVYSTLEKALDASGLHGRNEDIYFGDEYIEVYEVDGDTFGRYNKRTGNLEFFQG